MEWIQINKQQQLHTQDAKDYSHQKFPYKVFNDKEDKV